MDFSATATLKPSLRMKLGPGIFKALKIDFPGSIDANLLIALIFEAKFPGDSAVCTRKVFFLFFFQF